MISWQIPRANAAFLSISGFPFSQHALGANDPKIVRPEWSGRNKSQRQANFFNEWALFGQLW
jgi:hypothetical protein